MAEQFIEQIASLVRKYAPQYGILVHSPIIAQAILESDSGESYKATYGHNYHGLKYRENRVPISNGKFTDTSTEDRGEHDEEIVDEWFKFDSMEDGVIGYFQFISTPNYANLKGVTNPRTYLENIKADEYATDDDYVEKVMNVITNYNLTQYDTEQGASRMARVFLSAGHGGSDPGAVAYNMKEKDINLQILLACQAELLKHGVTVIASRTSDENDAVAQEVTEANASGADIAVSFHINAGGGDGFEAYYHTSSGKGKELALLGEKYVKELGQNSRGIKSGNHLYFVRKTTMTAVLFESFFVDNDTDNNIGDTLAEQKAFGVAYAKAILEYLGIPYVDSTEDSTIYRVQVGAYKVKKNADAMKKRLKDAGFNAVVVKK